VAGDQAKQRKTLLITMDVEEILTSLGSEDFRYNAGQDAFVTNCPFARWTHSSGTDHNPSFRVSLDTGAYKCYACGHHGGTLSGILLELVKLNPAEKSKYFKLIAGASEIYTEDALLSKAVRHFVEPEEEKVGRIKPFPEQFLNQFIPATESEIAMMYLELRGLSKKQIKKFEFVYDEDRLNVAMPVRDHNGVLYGLHGRSVDPNVEKKYRHWAYRNNGHTNIHVWLNQNNIDFNEPVVVCEGIFDITAIDKVNSNVMGSMTTNITPGRMKVLEKAPLIITFYDSGEAGDMARESIENKFPDNTLHCYCGEYDDPGEMPKTEIKKAMPKYI